MVSQSQIKKLREVFFDKAISHFMIFDENLTFVDINKSALKDLGLKKSLFKGKSLYELEPTIKEKGLDKIYKNIIKTGVSTRFEELDVTSGPTSRNFVVNMNAFKVHKGIGFIVDDITIHKNAINELQLIEEKLTTKSLELKQKNKELKKLSSIIMSHLKKPINEIDTLINDISKKNYTELKDEHLFEKIIDTSSLLNNKINALKEINDFNKNNERKTEKVYFDSILNSIKTEISEVLTETGTVINSDFTKKEYVYCSPIELHSVFYNLISNSIKYRNPSKKNVVKITSRITSEKIIIEIKDNGIGFDSELSKNKIFSIFKRMHTHVSGLGVGLYIVKSIIDSHNGTIEVKSKINKGTTFKIYLPI